MRERSIKEQHLNRCTHFNGLLNKECEAGILYETFREKAKHDGNVRRPWLPCLRDEGECIECEKRQWATEEEAEAEEAIIKAHTARTVLSLVAITEEAKRLGLRKGNGGAGEVKCPACAEGVIHFSVSGYNGHRWARCTTEDCVAFME